MKLVSALLLLFVAATVVIAQDPPPAPPADPEPAPAPSLTRMKLGEFWYGMHLHEGGTEGYARMTFSETKQGGLHCDWTLHIAGEGWKYEEDRQTTFDADWKLSYTEMSSGMQRVLAAREGNVMVGKSGVDDLRVEVNADAITGMGFILAGCMEQKKGARIERTEYNEAQGMAENGTSSIECVGQEEIELPEGKVKAWKYVMKRGDGQTPDLPLWVNDDRELVQADWGPSLMKLHRENTEELFKPAPPFLTQLEPKDKTKLVLTADYAEFTLEEMWGLWATGEGLAKWWPQEAEVEGKVGGKYQPTWRDENGDVVWQLLGKIEVWEPNKKLGYTWKWNTDPEDAPILHVLVEFAKIDGGVKVTITHSSFDPSNDDQINRQGLHDGWEAFCSKIPKLKQRTKEEEGGGEEK